MPLGTGWAQLTQERYNEVLPDGQIWSNGLPYLNFTKVSSRTKIDSLVATFGWEGMIGIFCSGDDGPNGVTDFILHRSEFPVILTPPAPSISINGNSGNRTYSYVVQGLNSDDKEVSTFSVTGSIGNGNANLSSNNSNTVSWGSIYNATKYRVYRTVNTGNNPSTGKTGLIGIVTGVSLTDTGLVGDGTSPISVADTVCMQNVLDNILKGVYVDSSGARSVWLNTHFWNLTLPYIPRISGVGNYNFQISDTPPGNPPWWREYN